MARDLSGATGIGTSPDFLNGNLVDNQTLVGEFINQDIVQFFQKLMADAGLTPNDLADNEANGYQFVEALVKSMQKPYEEWKEVGNDGGATTLNANFVQNSGEPLKYKKDKLGNTLISGGVTMVGTISSSDIFTLPTDYRVGNYRYKNVVSSSLGRHITVAYNNDRSLPTSDTGIVSFKDAEGTPPTSDIISVNMILPA